MEDETVDDIIIDGHFLRKELMSESFNPVQRNNCSVAFINKTLHIEECKRYCGAMGATYYRWFRGGCCECVGKHCKDSGIGRPMCIYRAS